MNLNLQKTSLQPKKWTFIMRTRIHVKIENMYSHFNVRKGKLLFHNCISTYLYLSLLYLRRLSFGYIALLSPVLLVYSASAQELSQYESEAIAEHPGVRARYAAFEAAVERIAVARGLPGPQLNFGYFVQPVETRVGPQQARAGLRQRLPWFGTLRARGDAAAREAEAKYMSFVQARESLRSEVRTHYARLWEHQQLLALEQENQRLLNDRRELAVRRLESGTGSLADVYRVDLKLEAAASRRHILRAAEVRERHRFNRLLGRDTSAAVEMPDSLPLPEAEAGKDTLKARRFQNHPQAVRYTQQAGAARSRGEVARRNGLPSFSLGLDYIWTGIRTTSEVRLPDNGQDAMLPTLSIDLPLYRRQHEAAEAQARAEAEVHAATAREEALKLALEMDEVDYQLRKAREEARRSQRQRALAEKTLALLLEANAAGRAGFEEVLRLQHALIEYRRQRIQAVAEAQRQQARLAYLHYQAPEDRPLTKNK